MTAERGTKVIFDTNIWISYLIGRRLSGLTDLIIEKEIQIILSDQLIDEIQEVTARPKLSKHFQKEDIEDLIDLLETIGEAFTVSTIPDVCRDPKDNFILGLASESQADFLVTGDEDLLILESYENTEIIQPAELIERLGASR